MKLAFIAGGAMFGLGIAAQQTQLYDLGKVWTDLDATQGGAVVADIAKAAGAGFVVPAWLEISLLAVFAVHFGMPAIQRILDRMNVAHQAEIDEKAKTADHARTVALLKLNAQINRGEPVP